MSKDITIKDLLELQFNNFEFLIKSCGTGKTLGKGGISYGNIKINKKGEKYLNTKVQREINLKFIKSLGKDKRKSNFDLLLQLYNLDLPIILKREIVSSIGRHHNLDDIYNFIKNEIYVAKQMDLVYQMFRTILYKSKKCELFRLLKHDVLKHFNNEVINRMEFFFTYKQENNKKGYSSRTEPFINKPLLLEGDNLEKLVSIPNNSIQLIFTSPPYYNAREYSNYRSYDTYLEEMKKTLLECHRVLEDGRFIIINVSPVLSSRPGREFESIRYPIHFDFHRILTDSGFYFIDEIIWAKPEASVPYRIGSFEKLKKPLLYKPKTITESILVYRKNTPFLIEKNVQLYDKKELIYQEEIIDTTNIWNIAPKSKKNHPAVFPELLCEKVLKYYSYKNDIVLDPFAGSGTLGKVALQMNRIPILCEIHEKYIELIKKMISNACC